jgi:chemotaxis protein MotB
MSKRRQHHEEHEEHENHERWLVTYADMITLLMVLFIVLFSMGQVDLEKYRKLRQGLQSGFGGGTEAKLLAGGGSLIENMAPIVMMQKYSPENADEALKMVRAQEAADRAEAERLEDVEGATREQLAKAGVENLVSFRLEDRGLVIGVVSDKLMFGSGSASLRPGGRGVIDQIAPALAKLPNLISVEGHTDDRPVSGQYPSNWELSSARASAVLRELAFFIPSDRLSAVGWADRKPLVSNATDAGRARNRRVEIVVLSAVKSPPTPSNSPIPTTAGTPTSSSVPPIATTAPPILAFIEPDEAGPDGTAARADRASPRSPPTTRPHTDADTAPVGDH